MERGYTFVKPNSTVIKWKIEKVSSYLNKKDGQSNSVESPLFSTGSKRGDHWKLKLSLNLNPSSTTSDLDGDSCIHLFNMGDFWDQPKTEIFILNSKQEEVLINQFQIGIRLGECWNSKIFKNKKLLKNMSKFTSNDTLTFVCKITVFDDAITIPNEKSCKSSNNHLANDLAKLYENKDHCDVTITVKDTKFQAHKSILSVRSPVLAAMFANDMIEKKSNEVFITDIDPEIFEKVLQYIYSDKLADLDGVAERVLEAADKYQIQSLKNICEDELIKSLNRENIIKIVALADRHNAKNLKDYAIKCIITDAEEIMATNEFEELEKTTPSLAWELLRKIVLAKMNNKPVVTITS